MEGKYPSAKSREREATLSLASQCCYAVVRSQREGGREGVVGESGREAWQTVGEAEASSAVLCAEGALSSLSKGEEWGGDGWGRGGEAKGESERGARQQEGRMSGAGGSKGG